VKEPVRPRAIGLNNIALEVGNHRAGTSVLRAPF
jgi:hypothetical protein